MFRLSTPLIALVLGLTVGCQSWSGVRFVPSPLTVAIAPDADAPALGNALFSWMGIERRKVGYGARFRVRIENESKGPLRLDPERCELIDGSLIAFGPAHVEPVQGAGAGTGWEVPPGESAVWSLIFPFPGDGDPELSDLSGLQLRLALVDETGGLRVSATFDRLQRERGYWGGSVYYGGGWYSSDYHDGDGAVGLYAARRY